MALVTFDGTAKIITVNSGVTSLDVQEDLYSEWKAWALDNPEFLPAFRAVGGDELQPGYFLASTYFLINDWRIRPAEEDRILNVIGNLYVDESTDSPYIPTIGTFRVMVNSTTSNIVNTIAIGSGVTNQDKTDIIEGVALELDEQTDEILDELQPDIKLILGLCHNNFKFYNQVYDGSGNLVTGTVRIFPTATDCTNNTNQIATWNIFASYNGQGRLTDYKVLNV